MAILRFLLFALFLFIVGTVAAFVYLPWWAAPFASLAVAMAIWQLGKLYFRWQIRKLGDKARALLFQGSEVLRGASVIVHSVEPTPTPSRLLSSEAWDEDREQEEDFDEDGQPLAHYRIDITIVPKRLVSEDDVWRVGALQLMPRNAPEFNPLNPESYGAFFLQDVEIEDQGRFVLDETRECRGRQRLRALIAVPAEMRELKFRYLGVSFGELNLPPPV